MIPTPLPAPRTPRARRAWVGVLALALVFAQLLGFAHQVAHVPLDEDAVPAQAHSHGHDHDHGHDAGHSRGHADAHAHHGLAALFAGHEEGSDCRLFDPLTQPGGLGVSDLFLPSLPLGALLAAGDAGCLVRWAALFDARGPPASR